ncbi:unnamed protein product [marine sediment metagenome]|uniref:Uncharacterized protein n=1 Tax=marine sediment metagenome TaxID=412755 RepID=X1J0A0_9ZZZZ
MVKKTGQKPKPKWKRRVHHPLEFGYTTSGDFKRAMVKNEGDQDDKSQA